MAKTYDNDVNKMLLGQQEDKPIKTQTKTSLEKFESDKRKGNHNSEEEKENTKKRNLEYINEYNKKNYYKLTIHLTAQHKAALDTLAEMNNMSVAGYIKMLIDQEKEKASPKEFAETYKKFYSNINKKAATTREERKQQLIDDIKKDAEKFFGQDPLTVDKKDRLQYIDKKMNEDDKKMELSVNIMCEALEVSRSWYYNIIVKQKK